MSSKARKLQRIEFDRADIVREARSGYRTSGPRGTLKYPIAPTSERMTSLNMSGSITKSLLVITGAIGAGKTSVVGEASDILNTTLHCPCCYRRGYAGACLSSHGVWER